MKYRKKPVVIEAVQLLWSTWHEMCGHLGPAFFTELGGSGIYINKHGHPTDDITERMGLRIPTLEGVMIAQEGDWVIRGTAGELYPCKDAIFKTIYEPVT